MAALWLTGASVADADAGSRLVGSAAGGLGPSSALADLDADGIPDIAVADRTGLDGEVAAYELRIVLSRGAAQALAFESVQRTLALVAADVDHDHDIDLVFTAIVGDHIVGIWLNDGRGHFSPGAGDGLPTQVPHVSALILPDRFAPIFMLTSPVRRLLDVSPIESTIGPPPRDCSVADANRPLNTDRHSPASPRGPPAPGISSTSL